MHQVKRQNRNANSWNVASLRDKEVWSSLRSHVDAGRAFHFVSTVPARTLDELADRARCSDTFADFQTEWLTDGLHGAFDVLAAADIYGSAATAWRMLRGLWVEWHNERDMVRTNGVLAEQALAGAPGRLAALGLGDLLLNSLGTTLDAPAINARLGEYGLRRVSRVDIVEVADAVSEVTRRWAASVDRALLRPTIPREAADQLVEWARSDAQQVIVLTGAAGGGKSAVLYQALDALTALDTTVLAFRLDRLAPFASTHELGLGVGMTMSPVSALGAAANGRACALIVDQLDAVSLASGRIPNTFDAVADLMDEALAYPAMRVVLVCRAFDATADPRIRHLTTSDRCAHISVGPLSDAQVLAAIASMGRAASHMTPSQRGLLRSPLHLALLAQVADHEKALSFRTTRQLFDAFWETKRKDCTRRQPSVRFHEAVSAVVGAMSTRQRLSVPDSVLDADDLAVSADVLVSEHICVREGRQLAFFHESFFDYAFARDWLRRDEDLVTFLAGGEQELFRRGQVRQVLDHLRDLDPERFTEEVEALLTSPEIRYHLKDVTLAVLGGLEAPTTSEWGAVTRVLETRPLFQAQLVSAVSNAAWFRRADDEAALDDWLTSADEREHDWAVRVMASAADVFPDRVARLMEPHSADPRFGSWLRRIVRFADLAGSRGLFDLLRGGVRIGDFAGREHTIWTSVRDLADKRPSWAVELIGAVVSDGPDALRLESGGRVADLLTRDYSAIRSVVSAALGAPGEFCVRVLPLLLAVMAATAIPPRAGCPVYDKHFTFRNPDGQSSDLGDALFQGVAKALRILAGQDPARARGLVAGLASVPYEAAQWLLYQVLIEAGPALAPWSAEILLQGRHRLLSGYVSNVVWGAREVLCAVGEALPDNTLVEVEKMLLHLRLPPDDELAPWHEFTLLTALPEDRISESAGRRLGELRRRYDDAQEPDKPQGIMSGVVGPPIRSEAAQHMSDDQWLGAMKKHSQDRTDWTIFTGGARELSHVLRSMTAAAPERFARLAVRMDAALHPAYGASLLQGLGDAEVHGAQDTVFAAVRHFSDQRRLAHDCWLGWAMRKYLTSVPLDLVAALLDRALGSDDPGDRGNAGEGDAADEVEVERDLLTAGINTVRGSAIESLGDLLMHAADGSRAVLVVPHLGSLAADLSLPVRACVAHLLHAAMRYDRPAVAKAFTVLVQAPDQLLALPQVIRLFVALCHGAPVTGRPVMERMLRSPTAAVRRIGGRIAAMAAMEWEMADLLATVLAGDDRAQRQGAADVCAQRLVNTGDAALAHHALVRFFHDPEEDVREAAAAVAAALRGRRLRPVRRTVTALIDSEAFAPALPQLLITLEEAPDRVDELVLACVRRFLTVFGAASADLATDASADTHHIGELLVRAHAQAASAARRSEILDLLDQLLLRGAYGVAEAICSADRG
ncbi:NACHT domain-containing protein [Streptomyces sp. DT9]